jgi:hypothetical protein
VLKKVEGNQMRSGKLLPATIILIGKYFVIV